MKLRSDRLEDLFGDYFKLAKRYHNLDFEEGCLLVEQARAGDAEAKQALVASCLRLCIKMARRRASWDRVYPIEDAVQVAILGVLECIEKFDASRGAKFVTAVVWYIRKAICEHRSAYQYIRTPRNWHPGTGGGIDALEMAQTATALDTGQHDQSDGRLTWDYIFGSAPDDHAEDIADREQREQVRSWLADGMRFLTDKQRQVITFRNGLGGHDPETLEEVGTRLGVTRERVRQVQAKAMDKLVKKVRSNWRAEQVDAEMGTLNGRTALHWGLIWVIQQHAGRRPQ